MNKKQGSQKGIRAGRNDRKNQKKNIGFVLGILGLLALAGGVTYGVEHLEQRGNRSSNKNVSNPAPVETAQREEPVVRQKLVFGDTTYELEDQVDVYVFLGTDNSGKSAEGGKKDDAKTGRKTDGESTDEDYQGDMADFILLVVMNRSTKEYGLIPVNRDTITEIPLMNEDGTAMATATQQLCTAHWYGGNRRLSGENTVATLENFLGGLSIQGFYEVGMDSIAELNDIVGGVTVTLEDDFTESDPKMKKGKKLHLDNEQAHIFVRSRMNVGDGSNLSRMRRQQQYMEKVLDKIKKKNRKDSEFGLKLYKGLKNMAETDISSGKAVKIANRMKKSKNLGMFEIKGESKVGNALSDGEQHEEFYVDTESLIQVLTTLTGMRKG